MIINDKYRFVFVHIPKTAGSSVRSVLGKLPGRNRVHTQGIRTRHETPTHMFVRLGLDASSPMPSRFNRIPVSDYFFFCFVRNPWARFCSLHRFVLAGGAGRKENDVVPEDVNDFARMLDDRDPWVLRLHSIRPQIDYISPQTGFVGRYENLDADFASVMSRLGLTAELPHRNASSYSKEDYRTLLKPGAADIIAKHYADDIAKFEYEF